MSFVKRETQNEHGQLSHDVAAAHWDELVHYNVQTTFFIVLHIDARLIKKSIFQKAVKM